MKNIINKSFKRELIVCFFTIALVPLVITCCFLIQIFKETISRDYEKRVTTQISEIKMAVVQLYDQFQGVTDEICQDELIVQGINKTDSWEKKKVYTELYEVTKNYRDITFFQIYNNEGICQYTTSSTEQVRELPVYWGILKVANAHGDKLIIRNVSEYDTSGNVLLQGVQAIRDYQDNLLGYVVFNMSEEHFERVLQGSYESQNSIAILDSFWEEVYSTRTARENTIAQTLRSRRMAGESLKQESDNLNFYISTIADIGLYIVVGREPVFTTDITATMFSVILIMALICLILSMILADRMSNYLTYPIKNLTFAMHDAESGNLDQSIVIDRSDEFGALSTSFNTMTKKLKEYMKLQVQHQKELNEANIAMMQAQLNPHFLYNTLDTIKWVAKANHVPELAKLSSSLAKILRSSISSKQFILLSEELKMVEYYIYIQKVRFDGTFTFDMEVPYELEDCIVPKLILQPIVENAIIHGLANREDGHIFLNAYEREGKLSIEVSDDGCGMGQELLDRLNSREREQLKDHIGFYNVDTIISLYYGEMYGLHAETLSSGGTKITVTIPINRGNNVLKE